MQVPLIVPPSAWEPPSLGELPSWGQAKRVAVDVETRDPYLKELGPGVRRPDSYIVGISFAIEDGPSGYLPIRHQGGGNLPVEQVLAYLRRQAKVFTGTIVGANLPYDLDWLAQEGIVFRNAAWFRDVQIAEPLIDELQLSYSLDNIAKRHGFPGKDETMLKEAAKHFRVHPKKEMWRLHSRFVGPYAEEDTRLPLQLLRRQERIIDDQDIWGVYDLESQLLPVLVKMRRRGVLIHQGRLEEIERWSEQQEREALAGVRHLTGVDIAVGDVWKADALAPALEAIGIKPGKTATGKVSIDKELLAHTDHDVARLLERARKTNKLRTTFAQSVHNHMVNGRIHCTFNQLRMEKDNGDLAGAAFGRLSCTNPNMQQQPARDEFAKMWRGIYLPEEGALWAADDYSQQEPRMLTHFAELVGLEGAKAAADRYRNDPNADNHQMMADMAQISRKEAKTIFLGLCYGMGGAKLCRDLGLPTAWRVRDPEERWVTYPVDSEQGREAAKRGGRKFEVAGEQGQKLLDAFDARVPFVRQLTKRTMDVAKARGYIMTLSGRRCRFPKDDRGRYDWTYKALNRLIQGSSADQTKTALVEADKAGFYLQLQVHDEIDLSVGTEAEAHKLANIMETCIPLNVPSKVDVEIGPSWGESMS